MKKLIALCFTMCFFTAIGTAQKLTQKDLQGTWKMERFSANGIVIDLWAATITLSPELEKQLTAEQKKDIQSGMAQVMEVFKESYAYVDGNNLRQTMGPQEQKGTFTVKDQDGKQFLAFTSEAGVAEDMAVSIKDKKLYISQGTGAEAAEFIYTKQP